MKLSTRFRIPRALFRNIRNAFGEGSAWEDIKNIWLYRLNTKKSADQFVYSCTTLFLALFILPCELAYNLILDLMHLAERALHVTFNLVRDLFILLIECVALFLALVTYVVVVLPINVVCHIYKQMTSNPDSEFVEAEPSIFSPAANHDYDDLENDGELGSGLAKEQHIQQYNVQKNFDHDENTLLYYYRLLQTPTVCSTFEGTRSQRRYE